MDHISQIQRAGCMIEQRPPAARRRITMPFRQKVQHQLERRYFIGGSDARIVMGNDEAALIQLWREKRGDAHPADLSGNLIVQLGTATEELNRVWYERNSGRRVIDVQRHVKHSIIPYMAATLDGI